MKIFRSMETEETKLPEKDLQEKADQFDRIQGYVKQRAQKKRDKNPK